MRYARMLFPLAILFLVPLIGCGDRDLTSADEVSGSRPAMDAVSAQAAEVGKMHNDGLAFVVAGLRAREAAGERMSSRAQTRVVARGRIEQYLTKKGIALTDAEWDRAQSSALNYRQTLEGLTERSELSDRARALIEEILDLAEQGPELKAFVEAVQEIKGEATATLTGRELGAVLAAASTARASAEYWQQNLSIWHRAMSVDQPAMTLNAVAAGPDDLEACGWKTLGSDVVGALAGGLTGGIFGAVVGGLAASTVTVITSC